MSFLSAAERFSDLDRSAILLDSQLCTHAHDQFSTCDACFEICPVGAIQPGTPPTLDADSCQSCLACLPVCPVGAFTANDGVQSLLTCVARLETKAVELVCGRHADADTGVSSATTGIRVRGCLAGLGTGSHLALAALGLKKIILRLDACTDCSWGSLQNTIQNQVELSGNLLSRWGMGETLVSLPKLDERADRLLLDADNPPLSRRDLFRMAAQQGQMTVARTMSADRPGSKPQPGRDRYRLISAIAHLPEPIEHLDVPIENSNFINLVISESCTACAVCARACPTGALGFNLNEEKTHYWLHFSPQTCIACEACIHVCAPEAIETDQNPTFKQVFGNSEAGVLSEGELSQCEQCKTFFDSKSDQKLCPVCEYRRKHPFGSMMPPGVKPAAQKARGQNSNDS